MESLRRRLLFLSGSCIAAMGFGCLSTGGELKPANSARTLEQFFAKRGLSVPTLTVPQLVDGVLAFYREVRASSLIQEPQADMLLYQWGVFDWGKGANFEIDITRQFISASAFDDDAISQLRCTALFAPTPALRSIPVSNLWCKSITEFASFGTFIRESAAYIAVQSLSPARVEVLWSRV
jgi:hypothetical protein